MALNAEQLVAIEVLHGLCTSAKDMQTLSQLLREYTDIEGKQLDYSGFSSITDMLRVSGRFNLMNHGGMLFVSGKLNADSVHIAAMVSKQRSNKKRGRIGPPPKDGLFRAVMPRKSRPSANYRKPGFVRPLHSQMQPRLVQPSRSCPQNMAGQLKITIPNKNYQSQRHVIPNSAPLPSQLAKVVKQEPYQSAPVRSSNNNFQFVQHENASPNVRPQQSLPKIVVVQQPKYDLDQKTLEPQVSHGNETSKILVVKQASETRTEPKVERSVDQLTEKFQNFSFKQDPVEKPRLPNISAKRPGSVFERLGPVNVFESVSRNVSKPAHLTFIKHKPSVQDRLEQIKRSPLPPIEIVTPIVTKKPKEKLKEKSKEKPVDDIQPEINIPLEWWTNVNIDDRSRLEQYCALKHLKPPEFFYFKVRHGRTHKFQCRVTIDDVTYSTYPDEFDMKEQSQIVCATRAVESIKELEALSKYPTFQGDDEEMAEKIYEIVNEHKAGVFLTKIPNLFRLKYKLSIPPHFSRIIEYDFKYWFKLDEDIPHKNKQIVYAVDRDTSSSKSDSETTDLTILPPKLDLPWNETYWNVIVQFPQSTTCVWCNLLGNDYYNALIDLYDEIANVDFMEPVNEVLVEEYYIAIVQETAHRVKVTDIDNDKNLYLSFFIDTGEQQWLKMSQLYVCDVKFLELPSQAISLSLKDLELFANLDGMDFCLSDYDNKVLVAQVHTTKEQYEQLGYLITVTLYDTLTEDDINVNNELLDKIAATVLKPTKLCMNMNSVKITRVLDNGIVSGYLWATGYVTMINQEIKRITADMEKLSQFQGHIQWDRSENEIFLFYDKLACHYSRVKIISCWSHEVVLNSIDYGTKLVIKDKQDVFKISSLSKALQIIPAQAIRMKLHDVPNTCDPYVLSLIRALLKPGTNVLVKVVQQAEEPSVFIHIRSNGVLLSVNDALKSQIQMTQNRVDDDNEYI